MLSISQTFRRTNGTSLLPLPRVFYTQTLTPSCIAFNRLFVIWSSREWHYSRVMLIYFFQSAWWLPPLFLLFLFPPSFLLFYAARTFSRFFFHYRFSRCSSSRARPCTIDRAYGFAALVIVPPNCRNVRCADVNANDICSA